MSDASKHKFTLKAVINKEKTKVLFAEVDNSFVNLLLSFATLPLGLIVEALVKHYGNKAPVIGSLNNLYNAFTKFCTLKYMKTYLHCEVRAYNFPLGNEVHFESNPPNYILGNGYFWVLKFLSGITSFFVCDDLRIVANCKGSILDTLNDVGVKVVDMDGAETRTVTLGVNEVMDFLVRLLISRHPLTDIIFGVKSEVAETKQEAGTPSHHIEKEKSSYYSKTILKATFQKSTNNLLFVQARKHFVDQIHSLLVTPLRSIDRRLGSNTCFNHIDTLSRCLYDLASKYINASTSIFLFSSEFDPDCDYTVMYLVTDDFTIRRLCLLTSLSVLDDMKISLSDVEELELQIESADVSNFLKTSLTSTLTLTDLINPALKRQLKPKQEQ